MSVQDLVNQILADNILTPSLETQINTLLWVKALDQQDMTALETLVDRLLQGEVRCTY